MKWKAIIALFLCTPLAALDCDGLLADLGFRHREAELLAAFTPGPVESQHLVNLGQDEPVYRIDHPNGNRYVLRFESYNDDISYEAFSSEVIRAAPGARTPAIRLLSVEESLALYRSLPANEQRNLLLENHDRIPRASVVVYFPMPSGRDTSPHSRTRSNIYNSLVEWAIGSRPTWGAARLRRHIAEEWAALTEPEKDALLVDFRALGAPFTTWTKDTFVPRFLEYLRTGDRGVFVGLVERSLNAFPEPLQRQLADHWALFTVLGLRDPHEGNWLVHNGTVLSIDLAMTDRRRGRGNPLNMGQLRTYPVRALALGEASDNAMIRRMSPELVTFFENLNEAQLRAMATRSTYPIRNAEIRHILERRDEILRRRRLLVG